MISRSVGYRTFFTFLNNWRIDPINLRSLIDGSASDAVGN
jgi:hypothetical protein